MHNMSPLSYEISGNFGQVVNSKSPDDYEKENVTTGIGCKFLLLPKNSPPRKRRFVATSSCPATSCPATLFTSIENVGNIFHAQLASGPSSNCSVFPATLPSPAIGPFICSENPPQPNTFGFLGFSTQQPVQTLCDRPNFPQELELPQEPASFVALCPQRPSSPIEPLNELLSLLGENDEEGFEGNRFSVEGLARELENLSKCFKTIDSEEEF